MPKISLSYRFFFQFKLVDLKQDIKTISVPKVWVFLQGHNFKPARKHCIYFFFMVLKILISPLGMGFLTSEYAVCMLYTV